MNSVTSYHGKRPHWGHERQTHIEHNETALDLITDMPGTWISVAMGHNLTKPARKDVAG